MRRRGLRTGLAAVAALGIAVTGVAVPMRGVRAGDDPATQRIEFHSGAEAFQHAWSLYSGATMAPFGGILEDGLRLRASGGYGAYSYAGPRAFGAASRVVDFDGKAGFVDALIGYHKQLGPMSVKVFAGVTAAQHQITPDDPETVIRGQGWGGKAVVETWWDITDKAWTSLDLSWTSLYDSYAARARLGWRFTPALSVGLEAGAAGHVEGEVARVGAFVRYEWAGGELSLSGGLASDIRCSRI